MRATLEWDSDGAGPRESVLVLGGAFTDAGTVRTGAIAVWDGEFSSLGQQLFGEVWTLGVFQGSLYAGGRFTIGSEPAIVGLARWNGESWEEVGGGLSGATGAEIPVVKMCVFGDRLVVSGHFHHAGNLATDYIAAWDGAHWSEMGGGAFTCPFPQMQRVGDRFYASSCSGIFRYVGPAWDDISPVEGGRTDFQHILTEYGGELVAVWNTYGAGNHSAHKRRFDGTTWWPLSWSCPQVSSVLVLNGTPYASRPTMYHPVGGSAPGGVCPLLGTPSGELGAFCGSVGILGEYRGRMVAGGSFYAIDGRPYANVAIGGETAWEPLSAGLGAAPLSLGWWDGVLYATTRITREVYQSYTDIDRLHRLTADGWVIDAMQTTGPFNNGLRFHGQTYVCGQIGTGSTSTTLGQVVGSRILVVAGAPNSAHQTYQALVFRDEILLLGSGVFAWNGTVWRTLADPSTTPNTTTKYSVAILNDQLYVGGSFTTFGGVAATNLVRWTGTAWEAVPGLSPTMVRKLATFQGNLVFHGTVSGDSRVGLWLWNGTIATFIGAPPLGQSIGAIAESQDKLIAAGRFTAMQNVPAVNLAQWDGAAWNAMSESVDGDAGLLAAMPRSLAVGGSFQHMNGEVAANFGLWGSGCVADFDVSGGIDGSDVQEFFRAWDAGQVAADVNEDGSVDGRDVGVFFAEWEAGGC